MNTTVSTHLTNALEVLVGTAFFSLLFFISVAFLKRYKTQPIWNGRLLTDNDCYDISLKIVTFLSSILNCIVGFVAIARLHDMDIMKEKYWLVRFWIFFSPGYYIYETVMKPYCFGREAGLPSRLATFVAFTRDQPLMTLHHVISLTLYYPALMWFRKGKYDYLVACFFLMDLSVPFLQVRHVMYRLGMSALPLYLWNGLAVLVAFFFCRIYLLYYIYWKLAAYHGISIIDSMRMLPSVCNYGMLSLLAMQGYWFCLMVGKLVKYSISHGKAE